MRTGDRIVGIDEAERKIDDERKITRKNLIDIKIKDNSY